MIRISLRRGLLLIVLPLVVLIGLYAALGFYAVPHFVRNGVQDFVNTRYHLSVALGEIRFNPFTLRLDVNDLALPDSDGRTMVAFRHLLVDLTVASVWRRGLSFQSIVLEQPYARAVIRRDGSLNLGDLALPPPPGTPPSSEPARLFLDRLSVAGGRLEFEDLAHPSEFRAEIQPIGFELRNFSTVGHTGGTYELSGASEAGERFTWTGSLSAYPLASRGRFTVQNLQTRTLWNFVRDSVNFESRSGSLALQGDYELTTGPGPMGLKINVPSATLSELGVRPAGRDDDYVRIDRIEIHDTRVDVGARTVSVGNVRIKGGDIRAWLQTGGKLNLLELTQSRAPVTPTATPPAPASGATVSAASKEREPAPAPGWMVSAPALGVEELKLSIEDRQVTPALTLRFDELRAEATGFATSGDAPINLSVSSRVNGGARLNAKAAVARDFKTLKLHTELDKLDLKEFQPYVVQRTALTVRSGDFSTKFDLERGADGQIVVHGDAEVGGLRTVDNAFQQDFFRVERLQVSGIDYHSQPESLHVKLIEARRPYSRVIVEADRTVNVSKVLSTPGAQNPSATKPSGTTPPPSPAVASAAASVAPSPAAATTPAASTDTAPAASTDTARAGSGDPVPGASAAAAPAPTVAATTTSTSTASAAPATAHAARSAKARGARSAKTRAAPSASSSESAPSGTMAISIDAVRIEDGSAHYSDFWIQPHFAVGIQTLHGSLLGLSSNPRARAKLELQGKVDRYAPVHIWGEVNPLAATAYSDLKLSFDGVEMTSATPYSGHFAGYKIEKGKLSVDIHYHIENRQLTAEHRFVINQLELGDRVESPDAVKLPLKIAIALLKDRNGVIDINLPVTGSLEDPQFALGGLIWKAVLGLLTKVATAPFAMLGHLFGGGEQVNFIDFQPGSARLDEEAQKKLGALREALKEKKQLQLDVPVTFVADVDRPGIAVRQLEQRMLATLQAPPGGRKHRQVATTVAPPAPAGAKAATTTGADSSDSTDPRLTDPATRYELLLALYRSDAAKDGTAPEAVQAVEAAKKQKQPPDFVSANDELTRLLVQRSAVPDNELESLGRHRAQAIQDALLSNNELDPNRIFIIGNERKPEPGTDKVRVELLLK